MKLSFGGHDFILHPSGALLWPDQDFLIVSDLHLEKSSWYARQGFFLPPYDSHDILASLLDVVQQSGMNRLLILGDCFHDANGYARLSPANQSLFESIVARNLIWIHGNHERGFVPEGVTGHDSFTISGITFRHEALPGAAGEISGHFHPKATVRHKGGNITHFCFMEDGKKMIMPAFGVYTGGLDVKMPALSRHFPSGARLYLSNRIRFFSFDASRIV